MEQSRESAAEPPDAWSILGSTGSIGRQALEVLAAVPSCELVGLAAGRASTSLLEQAALHGVTHVCLRDAKAAAEAAARAPELPVLAGEAGVQELVARAAADAAAAGVPLTVLNGIVGAAGLRATMAALEAGATLALANKESMVAGGPFVLEAARRSGSLILPVDSEHSALFQCLAAGAEGPGRLRPPALPAPGRRGARGAPPDRLRRPLPRPLGRGPGRRHARRRRSSTPTGRWAPRSPSTRPRS